MIAANGQANYQAKVAGQNADIAREEIALEQEAARREALLHYRKMAQMKGAQRAAAAAGGVSTDFGTAADMVMETDAMGREDAANIYKRSNQNVRSLDRKVSNFIAERNAARAAGKGAIFKGLLDMGSTVLGGVSQYKKLKTNYGTPGGGSTGGSGASGSFG
jgi:hypothetical protein